MNKNILLLNGSTRVKGNSLHICESLEQCFINKEVNVKIESIQQHFNKKDIKNMEEDFKNTDVIGLVAPLYVDALPYPVIAFLEEIEERFGAILKNKDFFVIVQCNFPQSFRNDPVVLSCECFAKELDMKFLGGLTYGGSVVRIEGKSLEKAGKEGERMICALDWLAEDVVNNREISKEAKDLFKNDIHPLFIRPFIVVGNIVFKQAKKKYMKSN